MVLLGWLAPVAVKAPLRHWCSNPMSPVRAKTLDSRTWASLTIERAVDRAIDRTRRIQVQGVEKRDVAVEMLVVVLFLVVVVGKERAAGKTVATRGGRDKAGPGLRGGALVAVQEGLGSADADACGGVCSDGVGMGSSSASSNASANASASGGCSGGGCGGCGGVGGVGDVVAAFGEAVLRHHRDGVLFRNNVLNPFVVPGFVYRCSRLVLYPSESRTVRERVSSRPYVCGKKRYQMGCRSSLTAQQPTRRKGSEQHGRGHRIG